MSHRHEPPYRPVVGQPLARRRDARAFGSGAVLIRFALPFSAAAPPARSGLVNPHPGASSSVIGFLRSALERPGRVPRSGPSDAAERLHAETAERLFDRLDPVRLDPGRVVALVAQGGLRDRLTARFPESRVVSCGPSLRVLPSDLPARRPFRASALVSSPSRLPLASGSADLVVSNLVLHWFADVVPILRETWRVLRPGGLTAFATFGPGTLEELRRSWRAVDDHTHIIEFMDMHDTGDAMVRAGFGDVVMDAERVTVTWPDAPAFLQDLRGLGTGNPHPGRPPGLVTPRKLAALVHALEAHRSDGRLPASVELVYGHGWKPEARAEVPLEFLTGRPR